MKSLFDQFRLCLAHRNTRWQKYLAAVIDPGLQLYSSNRIKDSFTFAKEMQNLQMHPKETFLCSFDIRSLFTNVPLAETIQICADAFSSVVGGGGGGGGGGAWAPLIGLWSMQNRMFFVLLRPIFWEKWKIAPPIRKQFPLKRQNLRNWTKNQSRYRWRPKFFFLEIT